MEQAKRAPMEETARNILKMFDRLGLTLLSAADLIGAAKDRTAAAAALADLVAQGCVRESFGQYERTEAGKLEAAEISDLTLLSRSGCHLCEETLLQIQPLAVRFGVRLRVIDIDSDRVLRERYNLHVPVLFLGHREVGRHRIDSRRVQKELSQTREP